MFFLLESKHLIQCRRSFFVPLAFGWALFHHPNERKIFFYESNVVFMHSHIMKRATFNVTSKTRSRKFLCSISFRFVIPVNKTYLVLFRKVFNVKKEISIKKAHFGSGRIELFRLMQHTTLNAECS